jgi:hypothetical protein
MPNRSKRYRDTMMMPQVIPFGDGRLPGRIRRSWPTVGVLLAPGARDVHFAGARDERAELSLDQLTQNDGDLS